LIYLVGEPGVGKSWLFTELTKSFVRTAPHTPAPRREFLLSPDRASIVGVELGARLGRHHAGYPGTDALPMNAVVAAERWLVSGDAARETPLILAEGARLGVRRFLNAAIAARIDTHVVLVTDPERAAKQRADRGSAQSPSWVRGATTRAVRFYAYALEAGVTAYAYAARSPEEVLAGLADLIR
jgi:hypothetical protein